MKERQEKEQNKKEVHYRGPGGMYSGVSISVKVLDAVIFAGIAVIAVLIFI